MEFFNNDHSKTKKTLHSSHTTIKKRELIDWCEANKEILEKTFLMRNRHNRPHDYGIYRASGQGL